MKIKLLFILIIVLPFIIQSTHAQSERDDDNFYDDIIYPEEPTIREVRKAGSSIKKYQNMNTWIPNLAPNDPLKNAPIKEIEVSFHIFLDDNGENSRYLDNSAGKQRLINTINIVNTIYSGKLKIGDHPLGPSDPIIPPEEELPNYDTRIRFTLGENYERIYFYQNSNLNKNCNTSNFSNFIKDNYPERGDKLNVYFTASYSSGKVKQDSIVITDGGNYGSVPNIVFTPSGATATAKLTSQSISEIVLSTEGSYNCFSPPSITFNGGICSRSAQAHVTNLCGGADGYANYPVSTYAVNSYVVLTKIHLNNSDTRIAMTLAHELGHNLSLKHTHSTNCDCSNPEFLSDVFGDCENNNCPHLAAWLDPWDNTLPDADRITNNMMSYSHDINYFSPMQAGQMHRALALLSVRKYVKKETHSDIPLIINDNEVWDFDIKLYRDIIVSSGAILTLSKKFTFPHNGKISIENGAALIIEGDISLEENNNIIVNKGGTLQLKSNSTINISKNGFIWIETGGYFCLENGSSIHLNDNESFIILCPSYRSGVNTSVLPSSNLCFSNPRNYPIAGNGEIKQYDEYIYVYNRTITQNTVYRARNIYVAQKRIFNIPGDVTIKNNAHVIFDALENVEFSTSGFDCEQGASFEVINPPKKN